MLNDNDINRIVNRIVTNINPNKIILFGSYAYGKPNEDSDLDLLIIKDMLMEKHKRGREIRKFLRGMKIPIDLLIYTNSEIEVLKNHKSTFISEILENGRVLYNKHNY
ncbi:nucleotidyltransferase domain-containing protein [Clostridium neuense]|uniref:Nucleotidyltransferase domain-containing protein n=1 Tax=Clostridium neuense TaxID=1728934 RepID=A0ABW8TJN0_9CLOT